MRLNMRCGKIAKKILIVFAVIIIAAIGLKFNEAANIDRVIGVTSKFIEIPCASPAPGARCIDSDPNSIAFYIKTPAGSVSYPPRSRNYNDYTAMGLFVSDSRVESTYENERRDSTERNYLIGGFSDTVRISYGLEDELSASLQWENLSPGVKYTEVFSDIRGYRKYDNPNCPSTGTRINEESRPKKEGIICTMRKALYFSDTHPGSLISCRQGLSQDNVLILRVCTITTKLLLGGRVKYSISSKHVTRGKWVELNEKIKTYIDARLVSARKD